MVTPDTSMLKSESEKQLQRVAEHREHTAHYASDLIGEHVCEGKVAVFSDTKPVRQFWKSEQDRFIAATIIWS